MAKTANNKGGWWGQKIIKVVGEDTNHGVKTANNKGGWWGQKIIKVVGEDTNHGYN